MNRKYAIYANDPLNINRGAYYGHPNGAPPVTMNTISAEAMAIVKRQATQHGFILHGSLTTNISFHKAAGVHQDFIFHV